MAIVVPLVPHLAMFKLAGVENIEAVFMTWTKWGLIAGYARSVDGIVIFESSDSNKLQYLPHGFHHITRGASCVNPFSISYQFL